MAKKDKRAKAKTKATDQSAVYKVIEIVGTSTQSWADAADKGLQTASRSVRDIRVAEVDKLDVKVEGTKLIYRAKLKVSFKYHGED